jgi:hypothetical protein
MRISLGLIALALGVAAGPTPAAPVTPVARQLTDLERRQQATAIETFETRYLEARKDEWHFHNTSLKLVGFQRADLDEIDIDEIETLLKNDPEVSTRHRVWGAGGVAL